LVLVVYVDRKEERSVCREDSRACEIKDEAGVNVARTDRQPKANPLCSCEVELWMSVRNAHGMKEVGENCVVATYLI